MIVRITNKCTMGCHHCMNNSSVDGEHMSCSLFKDSINFVKRYDSEIYLSGGEPTEHPNLLYFIDLSMKNNLTVYVGSNGSFLDNEEYANSLADLNITVFITNDPRFYPKKIRDFSAIKNFVKVNLKDIGPYGRAKKNNIKVGKLKPWCTDFRDKLSTYKNFREAMLKRNLKCRPSISPEGNVIMGASDCQAIGDIYQSEEILFRNATENYCNKCGLLERFNHSTKIDTGI